MLSSKNNRKYSKICQNKCLFSCDYMINHNEYNINRPRYNMDTTKIDLGLDIDTNIVNIRSVSV